MAFDYSSLKGKIVEKFGTNKKFAQAINMPATSLSMKLNNKTTWRQEEIESARIALELSPDDICKYFFCPISSKR